MRVISGIYRGRRLQLLSEKSKIRPVRDSQKEVIFNVLTYNQLCQHNDNPPYLGTRVLDIFAGTGSLGIEALSRGAKDVTFVDISEEAHQIISKNLQALHVDSKLVTLRKKNALFLGTASKKYHLVFLDPPFGHGVLTQALLRLHQKQWLQPQALCVAKITSRENFPALTQFTIATLKKTRDESILFLRYQDQPQPSQSQQDTTDSSDTSQ